MNILVTGAAGFIGRALIEKLLNDTDHSILAIDNMNDYYDIKLKQDRLLTIINRKNCTFNKIDITNEIDINKLFDNNNIDFVIHLAAQAGVRYSLINPESYAKNNLLGTTNILDACQRHKIKDFIFASSSSVYGKNKKVPFSESDNTDHPASFYAATKKANEVMSYSFSSLYDMRIVGLRFFTVYGPWGRPDMAPWMFTESILNEKPIKIFNYGDMARDFTYIDDITSGIISLILRNVECAKKFEIFNIGNGQPIKLMDFIKSIEVACGKEAIKEFLPMQDGDVPITYADTSLLNNEVGFNPTTSLQDGINNFVKWYKSYI